ncbi:fructokinase [Pseudoduganella lurida]|uniref:Fructokinase n=1 Tax=Pseudoduganella lurida TaxID=1036180 RepID=A0A562QXI7_9BURK|nr:PfkB family carbohydrate kinase [Pseudoduganella lurida]TWI61512.1 fructokinase [Pseudoduganella lurida]
MAQSVAVFGEALVDDFSSARVVGGAPFNLARHLAGFGLPVTMVTRIGDDDNGALIRNEFARYGMSEAGLQTGTGEATGSVHVEVGADGSHRFTIVPDQAYDHIDSAAATAAVAAADPGIFCFGTLAQRDPVSRAALHALLERTQAVRFLDLNLRPGHVTESIVFDSLQQADIVKVNEEELQQLFKWYCHTCPDTVNIECISVDTECRAMMHNFSLSTLIVTLGARGALYLSADGAHVSDHGAATGECFVDAVGAGDAFDAVFLLGRLRGWTTGRTLARANAFAHASCGHAGAVPPELATYARWLEAWAREDE